MKKLKETLKFKKIRKSIKKTIKTIKIWSKKYASTNVLFLTFTITSLVNAYILRCYTVKNYFNIKPIIADLAVILIIGSIGYLLKPRHQFKYFFTISIIFVTICIVNSVYYTNFISFASFSQLKTASQATGVGDAIKSIIEVKDLVFLYEIVAMLFVNAFLKKRKYYKRLDKIENSKKILVNTLVVGFIFLGLFISMLTSRDLSRLGKQWNKDSIVMEYGIYTYQLNDLVTTLKTSINPLFGFDSAKNEFDQFYDNRENTNTVNRYTNIFKGKNLLIIHGESIQNFVLDAKFNGVDVAPTVKKMAREGLYFSNFYSEESTGTSSDTEFTFASSLLPAKSGTVFMNYYNRDYVTVQKLLKDKGYYTFSMHGNNCSFWNRQSAHKSFGYDQFYCYKKDFDIDETIGLGLSDKSFFRQSIPKLKEINTNNKKWMGTLIMLSNHTPFTWIDEYSDYDVSKTVNIVNEKTGKVESVKRDYMEGTSLGSYFKSVHYADEALNQLFTDMDKEGLLDNTVVLIYGDHDNKLKKSEYNRYYNYDAINDTLLKEGDEGYTNVDYFFYEINRKVPLIIWTKDKKYQREIKETMGMIDIQPTIGNMFGFSNKYALGHDIFSVKDNVVVFPSGNWINNKMYYSQSKGEGKLIDDEATVSLEEIEKNNKYADKMISISNDIIIYDMIKKKNEALKIESH